MSSLKPRTSNLSPLKVKRVRLTSSAEAGLPLTSPDVATQIPCRSSLSAPLVVGAVTSRATQAAAGKSASEKAFMMHLLETIRTGRLTRASVAAYEGEAVRTAGEARALTSGKVRGTKLDRSS